MSAGDGAHGRTTPTDWRPRRLGTQGMVAAPIGFGCMGLTSAYGGTDEQTAAHVLHHALASGVTMVDTAESYGPLTNETLVGRALAGRRDHVTLATKFGFRLESGAIVGVDGSPSNVRRAVEGSLARLRTTHIDVLYQHRVDRNVPIEETIGAMGRLAHEGKVRFLGLSEAGADTIRRAHAEHPISVLQTEYSVWERGVERSILPVMRQIGIGLIAYSPLGRGFLARRITDMRRLPPADYRHQDPRFHDGPFATNTMIIDALDRLARELGVTAAAIALAWLLARGDDIVPIPGTTSIEHFDQNCEALQVHLTPAHMTELDDLARLRAGDRYAPVHLSRIEPD
jgi:aryl-alcohol dehydrogenase-like predicted oxidoreductase